MDTIMFTAINRGTEKLKNLLKNINPEYHEKSIDSIHFNDVTESGEAVCI
jgi:hypothetical protein